MPRLPLLMICAAITASIYCASIFPQSTAPTKAPKYPLRLHVLAVDDTHRTVRMQPNFCSGTIPDVGGNPATDTGGSSPCGSGGGPTYLGGADDDFAGSGRGDLVTPPSETQALSFTYEGCGRVRVPPGFVSLEARWKKRGKLEVLMPSDAIVGANRDMPVQKCTLSVKLEEFVYLRLRNGSIVKVAQEAYYEKPSLRRFLSGGSESLQRRANTVSVDQLATKTTPPPAIE